MFQIDLNKKYCLPFHDFRCPLFAGQYRIPPRNFRKSGFHQDIISDILVHVLKLHV